MNPKIFCFFFLLCSVLNTGKGQNEIDPDTMPYVVGSSDSIIFQSPKRLSIKSIAVVRFENSASAYLKWDGPPNVSYFLRKKARGTDAWTETSQNSTEALIEDLPLDANFEWEVRANTLDGGGSYVSDRGLISTYPQVEPIKVSNTLYNNLTEWFGKQDQTTPFCTFLKDVNVNVYEKMSFLQAYAFNNVPFTKSTGSSISGYLPSGLGEIECTPPEQGCNCKVISDGSNLPSPVGAINEVTGIQTPKTYSKIVRSPGDKTFVDHYVSGAAHYIALRQDEGAGGTLHEVSNLPGSIDSSAVASNYSEIQFFLACMRSNGGTSTLLPSDCGCKRPLDVQFEYTTKLFVRAETKNCIFSKGAEAQAEEVAFVMDYNSKTGKISAVGNARQAMYFAKCGSSWNPQFWINVLNLTKPVADYLLAKRDSTKSRLPSSAQVDSFLLALKTLIGTPFRNSAGTCKSSSRESTLAWGQKHYDLVPNESIRITLFSAYYARTRGYGCYRAEAGMASDYYLMGVVESQLDAGPDCCSEKFGNYIVGSLSTPPNGDVPIDAVNSIPDRLRKVGFELARYGSWDGLPTGASSGIILLNKEFDRIHGPSCSNGDDQENQSGNPVTNERTTLFDKSLFKVYPNVVQDILKVEINLPTDSPVRITLLNMQGKAIDTFLDKMANQGHHLFDFSIGDVADGNYLVHCQVNGKNQTFKVSIIK